MSKLSRRRLLEDSLALLAVSAAPLAAVAAPAGAWRRRVSPNETIDVAVIGFNGQGSGHINNLLSKPDVNLVALCDPDTAVWEKGLRAAEKAGKPAPKTFTDIRKLLEMKDLDAVSIATPNHWHALGAIWAMQAGKHVYVEKPISHEVAEGRRVVEAARYYKKICQCGTQSRSNTGMREAMEFLASGKLGKITLARGLCYKPRGTIGLTTSAQQPPSTVDYDLWLGPAPRKEVRRQRFHYDWHWFWDYGNGDIGNQGIHEMDKARWGLGKNTMPRSVLSLGGRFGYVDDGETANTQLAFFDYGDCQLIFEVRGLATPDLHGAKVGNIFYGTEGLLVSANYSSATAFNTSGEKIAEFKGGDDHFRNWLNAIRSGRHQDLHADCEEGHLSSALCHLANISYRLGKLEPFNPRTKAFGDDKEAYETLGRMEEHLAANGIRLEETKYRLGRKLRLNGERFAGDAEANRMLTRDYRAPYVVPARIG